MKKNRALKRLSILLVFVFTFTQMGTGFNFGDTKVYARDTTSTTENQGVLVSTATGDVPTVVPTDTPTPTPAIIPAITVDASSVIEGSENGGIIRVNLINGIFKADGAYDSTTVMISSSGLPVGVTEGTVTRESDTQLKIQLVGNRTVDYDTNKTVLVNVTKALVTTATNDISASGFITAIIEPAPPAPTAIFSFTGTNAGKLMQCTLDMEYSLDGGTRYIPANTADPSINTNLVTADKNILVRVKASGAYDPGNVQPIDILQGPALTTVSGNDSTNTVAGLDNTMEFSTDAGNTWTPYNNNTPSLTGNLVLKVRKKAEGVTAPGIITSMSFTLPIPAAPTVTFSFSDTNAGRLMGSTTAMEYSLNGGAGYNTITTSNMLINTNDITANNDIRIRVSASGITPAGNVTLIDIREGASSAPSVTGNDTTNTVTGMTTSMEFSTNAYTWTVYNNSNLPDLSGSVILRVRVKGNGLTMPGASTNLMFTTLATPTVAPVIAGGAGGAATTNTAFPELPAVSGLNTITAATALKVSDSVDLMKKALLKTDGVTQAKNAENIGIAANNIKDLALIMTKISDKAALANLMSQTTALMGGINSAASKISDEESSIKTIEGLSKAFTNAEAVLKLAQNETQRSAISEQILNLLKMTNQNMKNISVGDRGLKAAASIVDSFDSVMAAAQNAGVSFNCSSELQGVVQIALEKAGTQITTSVVAKNIAKATVTDSVLSELMAKIDIVGNGTKDVSNKLSKSGRTSLDASITINVAGASGANAVQTEFPVKVLSTIKGKGIDKLKIKTGIATIAIPANAINTAGMTNVSLGVRTLDTTKDLSKAQKAKVGNNPVFDFNLVATKKDGKKAVVSSFSDNIGITIPYNLADGQDPMKITVFFISDKGVLENKAGIYDATTSTVTFTTNHFSKYFIKENKVSFTDLKGYEEYAFFIEAIAAKGIVKTNGNKFAPSENVTKGDLAKLLVMISKSRGITDKEIDGKLKDIKKTDENYGIYAAAIKAGMFSSDKNGMFKPETKLTREDVAVSVAKWAELNKGWSVNEEIVNNLSYTDKKSIKTTSLKSIALMSKYYVMVAKTGTNFEPNGFVNKAEVSKIIYQLMNTK